MVKITEIFITFALLSVFHPTSSTEFTYDLNGNRTNMKDTQNSVTLNTSYSYDSMDRLTQMVQDGHSVNYKYDGSDNITGVFYPIEEGDLQRDVEYIYDSYNRLEKILSENKTVQEYFYTGSGMVDYVKNYRQFDTSGTGYVKVDYSYNTAGLPVNIKYLDNGIVNKEEYTMSYDKRGFITCETVFTSYDEAKTINKSYTYDSIGRLTTALEGAKTTNYTYDKIGNRLTMNDGTDSFTYSYNQFNFLTEIKKNGTVDSKKQWI